jgi:nicotinate-nucleotide adenylyltransferase
MKIGLYFGSFNPIHNGHLIIANYIRQYSDLDQIWIVVTPHNPFKINNTLLNEYQRLEMVKLCIEGEQNIRVTDIEFHLPKPSYTINTLMYLEEKYPRNQFSLIMGSDSLLNLDKWKNGQLIKNKYPIYLYQRPGFPLNENHMAKDVKFCNAPMTEISASLIRKMIQENKSIRYLVPDIVKDEIERNGYYKLKI